MLQKKRKDYLYTYNFLNIQLVYTIALFAKRVCVWRQTWQIFVVENHFMFNKKGLEIVFFQFYKSKLRQEQKSTLGIQLHFLYIMILIPIILWEVYELFILIMFWKMLYINLAYTIINLSTTVWFGLWCLMSLSTIFQLSLYIVAVSFIGGGNQSTWRKPLIYRKSLTNFITWCCIKHTSPWTGFKVTTLVVIGTDCIGSCKSNYHMITTITSPSTVQVL